MGILVHQADVKMGLWKSFFLAVLKDVIYRAAHDLLIIFTSSVSLEEDLFSEDTPLFNVRSAKEEKKNEYKSKTKPTSFYGAKDAGPKEDSDSDWEGLDGTPFTTY